MSSEFLQGAAFWLRHFVVCWFRSSHSILNGGIAKKTSVEQEILTDIVDYSVPRRDHRPKFGQVSYKELKSGSIMVNGKKVRVSSLSLKMAEEFQDSQNMDSRRNILLNSRPSSSCLQTLFLSQCGKQRKSLRYRHAPSGNLHRKREISAIAKRIVTRSVNHIVVVDDAGKLLDIVTSWDITRAMAEGKKALADIESRNVVTAKPDEPLEIASKRMAQNNISALPVIDIERKVLGIVTSEDVSKLLGR
jgi:CBS domain-containing protein